MKITGHLSDKAVLAEMGQRLSRVRISRGMTQVQLAFQSGVSRSTVERIESGESAQLSSLLRILRTLDLLEGLNDWVPEPTLSPMQLLELKGKERKRAPRAVKAGPLGVQPWKWGDEE